MKSNPDFIYHRWHHAGPSIVVLQSSLLPKIFVMWRSAVLWRGHGAAGGHGRICTPTNLTAIHKWRGAGCSETAHRTVVSGARPAGLRGVAPVTSTRTRGLTATHCLSHVPAMTESSHVDPAAVPRSDGPAVLGQDGTGPLAIATVLAIEHSSPTVKTFWLAATPYIDHAQQPSALTPSWGHAQGGQELTLPSQSAAVATALNSCGTHHPIR
jgi:hypothetical protein